MTILVDSAVWPWRGRLWAHLVSDASLDELHAFAARLALPERSFGGDHYDITDALRDCHRGGRNRWTLARSCRALHAAGLRKRPAHRHQP